MPGLSEGADGYDYEEAGSAKIRALRPLIYYFIRRVIGPLNGFMSIEPDIEATDVSDDVVVLKNWKVAGASERKCKLLSIKIRERLQELGYEVSGLWGQNFDLRIPREEFESVVSGGA